MTIIYKGYEFIEFEEVKKQWKDNKIIPLLLNDSIINDIKKHCQTINNRDYLKHESYTILSKLLDDNNSHAIYEHLDDIINGYCLCVVCDDVIPTGEELHEIDTEHTLCENCALFDDERGGYVKSYD